MTPEDLAQIGSLIDAAEQRTASRTEQLIAAAEQRMTDRTEQLIGAAEQRMTERQERAFGAAAANLTDLRQEFIGRFDRLEKRIDDSDRRFDRMENQLYTLTIQHAGIAKSLGTIDGTTSHTLAAQQSAIDNLSVRLKRLEEKQPGQQQ